VVPRRWSVREGVPTCSRAGRSVAWLLLVAAMIPAPSVRSSLSLEGPHPAFATAASAPVSNFTASINRLVDLVALAGSGILALVWARVALSWFSNDITKKIQAKERARDALIGTLIFMAAVTGLVYGLANWVLTGS
jgi:hypothetical protein